MQALDWVYTLACNRAARSARFPELAAADMAAMMKVTEHLKLFGGLEQ